MAAVDDRELSSDLHEQPEPAASASVSAQPIDLSCIHWGYLNSALVQDPSKKLKELTWKTYWVDLCGSTLRLYRDLSLSHDSASYPPPTKVTGPTTDNEKKEAFLVLKKGASISMWDSNKVKYKKKNKKSESLKINVFKLQVVNSNNSPVYLFEAPSKSSMYRWISKIEEGIDMADNPQNHSTSDKRLQEAKLLAMESRRYQTVAPELKYSDIKEDTDSGMEGDEESFEVPEKPASDPRLENLRKSLQIKQELLKILEEGEKAFIGDRQSVEAIKVSEFKTTTKTDYYLIPGYTSTLIPKDTQINILSQLPNKRWRCYVDLPKTDTQTTPSASTESDFSSLSNSRCSTPSWENSGASLFFDNEQSTDETERLIGSVPSSLLIDINQTLTVPLNDEHLAVMGTPDLTPNPSPLPSPPQSPYSSHKYREPSNDGSEGFESFQRRSPTNLQRFVPSMDLSDVDAWEQFIFPSPPSTPVTSRSTTPSLSPSESLENLDDSVEGENRVSVSDDVPITVIDETGGSPVTSGSTAQYSAVVRLRDEAATESPKNYSFLVTKKLRQRGISLIVGSSSSEDEDDDEPRGGIKSKISRRKLDEELEQFTAEDNTPATVRPYSAFVPRKGTNISFGISPKTSNLRTATTDELLRDYSSPYITRSKTCVTIKSLGGFRTPENAPPLNQRRTIQMERSENGGFGFTLQTYGIVQQNGEVEYMTFVLAVEEDGPAYMAGMRPGDIIIVIENQDTEDADHKTIVEMLQKAPATVRMVVVFVDAIRRMHFNTKIKVLRSELEEREEEFKKLSQKEHELITHSNSVTDLDVFGTTRSRQNSYLYTTELTSSFSKDSPKVKDSLIKYKQILDEKPARRTSLPDQRELKKQHLVSTTGNELLKTFASSADSVLKKSASVKLKRKVMKTKQNSMTFKSYIDMDNVQDEGPLRTSSPLSKKNPSDTENTRLSWPSTSHGSPSTEQDSKAKSLPLDSSRGLCSAPGNEASTRQENKTKGSSLDSARGLGGPPEEGFIPKPNPLMVSELKTDPARQSNASAAGTAKTQSGASIDSPKMAITRTSSNDKDASSNYRDDTRVKSPCLDSANLRKAQSNDAQASSTNDDCERLENNENKKLDKQAKKSGEKSTNVTTESETTAQKCNEKLTNRFLNTRKDFPDTSMEKNNMNRTLQTRENSSSSSKVLPKSPKLPRPNKPYSLISGSSNKDRPCSNNIASLRKIFEGESPSCRSLSPDVEEKEEEVEKEEDEEERDEFPIEMKPGSVHNPPEFAKPRSGLRPMSFMYAMDAAEESPLIPDDNYLAESKNDQRLYESSA